MKQKLKTSQVISLFLLVITGCAYGPDFERKNTASYFHGDNYNPPLGLYGFPVVERRAKATHIEGRLFYFHQGKSVPLKFHPVQLLKDGKTFLTAATDSLGFFQFSGTISNGEYILMSKVGRTHIKRTVHVEKYRHQGMDLIILRSPPAYNQKKDPRPLPLE